MTNIKNGCATTILENGTEVNIVNPDDADARQVRFNTVALDAHEEEGGYSQLLRTLAKQLREEWEFETPGDMRKRNELRLRVEGIADYAEREGI